MNNFELKKKARYIPYFRNVFMRNNLPIKIWRNESGIVNLDDQRGRGTHWCAYIKRGKYIYYFDSFGDLRPPKELIKYFSPSNKLIFYNRQRFQSNNSSRCGQYCLDFLKTVSKYI